MQVQIIIPIPGKRKPKVAISNTLFSDTNHGAGTVRINRAGTTKWK